MKRKLKVSTMWSIAGMLLMLAGLFAGLGGKPVAVYIACGSIFLVVALGARAREQAAEKTNDKK